jgi:hypothetical protein
MATTDRVARAVAGKPSAIDEAEAGFEPLTSSLNGMRSREAANNKRGGQLRCEKQC